MWKVKLEGRIELFCDATNFTEKYPQSLYMLLSRVRTVEDVKISILDPPYMRKFFMKQYEYCRRLFAVSAMFETRTQYQARTEDVNDVERMFDFLANVDLDQQHVDVVDDCQLEPSTMLSQRKSLPIRLQNTEHRILEEPNDVDVANVRTNERDVSIHGTTQRKRWNSFCGISTAVTDDVHRKDDSGSDIEDPSKFKSFKKINK